MAKVGFIGLGKMGQGMAGRLLSAGHTLSVYNRTPEKALDLVESGAYLAETPRAAADGADAVFAMLSAELRLKDTHYGVQLFDQFSQAEALGSAAQSAFQRVVDAGFGEFSESKVIDFLGEK